MYHHLCDDYLESTSDRLDGNSVKCLGGLDYHDDHCAMYAFNVAGAIHLCSTRKVLHHLLGNNPSDQKTYLAPFPEILSTFITENTIYKPEYKSLAVETPIHQGIPQALQQLKSQVFASEIEGISTQLLEVQSKVGLYCIDMYYQMSTKLIKTAMSKTDKKWKDTCSPYELPQQILGF